jgi:allantoin racemase
VKKLLVLAPFAMDERSLDNRRAQTAEVDLGPDVEVHYRAVRAGPTTYDSHHDWLLAEVGLLEAGMDAEAEGFAGVCIDTLSDAAVNVLRSVVDIPVFGAGLPSYLMALAIGRTFSILTQWDPWIPLYERVLVESGLRGRCVSIRSINMRPDLENLLGGKVEVVVPRLVEEGSRCIEDGADVIVLGSTTMHQAHAPLAASLPVPVINPGPTSYKLVEALIGLGLTHSRHAYLKETAPKKEMIRAMLEAARRVETPGS